MWVAGLLTTDRGGQNDEQNREDHLLPVREETVLLQETRLDFIKQDKFYNKLAWFIKLHSVW